MNIQRTDGGSVTKSLPKFELIDKNGVPWASDFTSATAAAAKARKLWPDQEQDPERTGKGWDGIFPSLERTMVDDLKRTDALVNRFLRKSDVNPWTGCWEWMAGKDTHGYGQMKVGGRKQLAHRLSYKFYRGPIPDGMGVLHECDNPACVNPDHLFLGTQADNVADMIAKGRDRKASQKGEAHGRSKLTEADVIAIRAATGASQGELASRYGVSQSAISLIRLGKKWKHVQVVGAGR